MEMSNTINRSSRSRHAELSILQCSKLLLLLNSKASPKSFVSTQVVTLGSRINEERRLGLLIGLYYDEVSDLSGTASLNLIQDLLRF